MQVVRSTDWYFCIKNQELIYLNGDVVVMQTRLARCLEALILHAGETISYDELLLKVWKTEHRDSSTISSVIAELRKLINCRKQGPTYIKTVPKKGYCFTGWVEMIELSPQEIASLKQANRPLSAPDNPFLTSESARHQKAASETEKPKLEQQVNMMTGSHPARKVTWWVAGALVFLTLVIIGIYGGSIEDSSDTASTPKYDGLHIYTYEPGLELEFDVSQSNEWMVYTHQPSLSAPKTIILKNLLSNKSFEYDSVSGHSIYSASFSPDSSKLVYIRSTEEECQVRTVKIEKTGFAKETDKYISSCGLSRIWTTTTFSADGKTIFFSRSQSLADPLKIVKLNLETGFERQITSPASSGRGDYSFSLSPDGERLAIVRNHLWQSTNIMLLELESEEISNVQSLPYLILGVGWKDSETLLYVDAEKRFVAFDLNKNREEYLISSERHLNYPVVRNERIFASRGEILDSTIWSFPISENPDTKPVPFIDTPYKDQAPVATENGVYFISDRTGKNQIWQQSNRGLNQISKFDNSALIEEIVVAPAHNRLLGLSNHRLFSIDLDTKHLTYLSDSAESIKNFTLSADGNYLLYALEKDELWSIYRYDIVSESHEFLFRGFSVKPVENELYFTKLRKTGLWKFNLNTGNEELIVDRNDFKALQYWHITDHSLIYLVDRSIHYYSLKEMREIWQVDLGNRSKNLSCFNDTDICYFELLSSGNTEIIELRKNKEF